MIHMAVVQVLTTHDQEWRVEIHDSGRCEIRWRGMLRANCGRSMLRKRLVALGLDLDQMVAG